MTAREVELDATLRPERISLEIPGAGKIHVTATPRLDIVDGKLAVTVDLDVQSPDILLGGES